MPATSLSARAAAPAWLPLALLVALAALLRLPTLDVQSLGLDEATTAELVRGDLGDVLARVADAESAPPLHPLLLGAWAQAAGAGEVALRLPSALAGIALVPVTAALGGALAGRSAGLASAGLVAVHPWLVWFSQEARAPALAALLCALALLCAVRAGQATEPGPRAVWAAGLALSGALALLTHDVAAVLVGPAALWLLVRTRGARPVLAAAATLAAVLAVLVPLALERREDRGAASVAGESGLAARQGELAERLLAGELGAPVGVLTPLAGLLAAGLVLLALTRAHARGRRAAVLALGAAGAAWALSTALALAGPDLHLPRDLVVVLVPLCVVLGVGATARGAVRAGGALLAALAALHGALVVAGARDEQLQRDDWRAAAAALGPAPPGGRALVVAPHVPSPLRVYRPEVAPLPSGASVPEVVLLEMRRGAAPPPAPAPPPGFALAATTSAPTWVAYRYRAPRPVPVDGAALAATLRLDAGRRHAVHLQVPPGQARATAG